MERDKQESEGRATGYLLFFSGCTTCKCSRYFARVHYIILITLFITYFLSYQSHYIPSIFFLFAASSYSNSINIWIIGKNNKKSYHKKDFIRTSHSLTTHFHERGTTLTDILWMQLSDQLYSFYWHLYCLQLLVPSSLIKTIIENCIYFGFYKDLKMIAFYFYQLIHLQ